MALTKVRGSGLDGATALKGQELIIDSDGDSSITSDTDDQIDIKTGGTDRAVFLANNMHLIGGNVARVQLSSSGTGTTPNTGNNNVHIEGNDDNLILNSAGNGHLILQENGTERIRIHATKNNVKIGENTGTLYGDAPLIVERQESGNDSVIRTRHPSTNSRYHMDFFNSSGSQGNITVLSSSVQYNTSSDYRLKENIVTDWDATTRLKQLKPSRFNFKADKDKTVEGFLAHEVFEVVPQAVMGKKDAVDKDGNPEYQSMDASKLVPLLVKTIQELEKRISTLESK
tara:strand:+ start:19 stop:876 length:858 start_codon:yes stop_codon:yes gene_type:complete